MFALIAGAEDFFFFDAVVAAEAGDLAERLGALGARREAGALVVFPLDFDGDEGGRRRGGDVDADGIVVVVVFFFVVVAAEALVAALGAVFCLDEARVARVMP